MEVTLLGWKYGSARKLLRLSRAIGLITWLGCPSMVSLRTLVLRRLIRLFTVMCALLVVLLMW